jgi:murein DD-endopeptidase MepM/ murein hydrolase activator NlpD
VSPPRSSSGAEHVANEPIRPAASGLIWPIDCIPSQTCAAVGHADVDKNNVAFDCKMPFIIGHEGTDIAITHEQMRAGIPVYAAADGEVLWVFDGKFDGCPNANEPDCAMPAAAPEPGTSQGAVVCTELGPYCPEGEGECYWCFAGGNVVVIRHRNTPGVFATRYDHLRKNSIAVKPGDTVRAGDQIGLVGSAGHSTQPHLHFEVWGDTYYDPTEPFAGKCGTNTSKSLWQHDPPWSAGR